MFVYNRVDHFKKTVKALEECILASDTELFIYSDGPKNDGGKEAVDLVRVFAHDVEAHSTFKRVAIIESPANKGLAASVISGVTDIIEQYGKAIVLEDDCVASPHLLVYMNACLERFEKDKRIGAIAGFSPSIELPDDYSADIYTAYRSCSWGWATWADRWANVDWELDSICEVYNSSELLSKLNLNGTDRFIRLYRQSKSNRNSWSVKFGWHLIRNDMLTVYPRFSYVDNIGCDSSGVHSKKGDDAKTKSDLSLAISDPRIEYVAPDDRIQKQMKRFYSDGTMSDVKRAIATKAIVFKEKRKR